MRTPTTSPMAAAYTIKMAVTRLSPGRRFLQGMRRTARAELTIDVLGEYLDDLDNVRRGAANAERPVDVTKTLENWDSLDIVLQQSFLSDRR